MSEQATSFEERVCMQWKQTELIGGAPVYYLDESHAVAIKNYIDRIDIVFFERVKELEEYFCRITKKHSLDAKQIKEDYDSLNEEYPQLNQKFLERMQIELAANQHKGDWKEWHPSKFDILSDLQHHLNKLQFAVMEDEKDLTAEYAADLANITMKAFDEFGSVEQTQTKPSEV
jgi:hypothetical protein